MLLEPRERVAYQAMTCEEQARVNDRAWWLADPLWSETGNDRLVEHYYRKVLLCIRTAMPRDERWDWRAEAGGDARAEMVVRYEWPSVVAWGGGGSNPDDDHDGAATALRQQAAAAAGYPIPGSAAPYTTYEYDRGRVHLLPRSPLIFSPYESKAHDWALYAPP